MNMNDTRSGRKDKNQHIQVFVRVRPISNNEKCGRSVNVIDVPNDKEVIVHERPQEKFSKRFKFNTVFGPSSKQIDVYNAVVGPLLEEVLAGYNCTVFAYGQTGTGKTFTMEGVNNDPTLHWQSDSSAGMIPRSLSHLFDELQLLEAQEYTIRVSFLEIYNEELFDLLSPNDDGSKIRLYEDASKKGAVIIHGLEEVTIHNKSEVYKILEKGSEKRQTAATLMNAHSSRSHVVFSITIHIKENTIDGEDVLKTGKLNLVDLAGSENVGKSGAVDRRAREAGSINQSLLTLGRVITALVARAPHVPYRESKLTRLLQESLGGRTKTSIIATVSPDSINLEETLSTLDYAHRAKNITNRPEVNKKLSKREFLKQYTEEIERLRRDLLATRERNGVYLANDNYNEMQTIISQQTKEIEDKINHIKALEKNMQDKEKIYNELELQHVTQTHELSEVKVKLNSVTNALVSTNNRLKMTAKERDEQKYLVQKLVSTEQALLSQAQTLLNVADTATTDSYKLHEKIDRKTQAEHTLTNLGEQFKNNVSECVKNIEKDISSYGGKLKEFCTLLRKDIVSQIIAECGSIDTAVCQISTNLTNQHLIETNSLTNNVNEYYLNYQNWIDEEIKTTAGTMEHEKMLSNEVTIKLAQQIDGLIENEIAKNLQALRNNMSQKLKQALSHISEKIDIICSRQLENYERMNKNINSIKTDVEHLSKRQEFTQKQRLFAKMMEDVSVQFNLLNRSQKEHYSVVTDKCTYIDEICNNISEQSESTCNANIEIQNNFKEQIQNDLKKTEAIVIIGTEENEKLAKITTDRGKILVNELKSSMGASYDMLQQYKNLVEYHGKEVKQNMDVDKNEIILSVNDAHKIVTNASKNRTEFMEDQKIKSSDISEDLSNTLENRSTESTAWSNRVIEQLHETVTEVNKFFDEELQRDIPTGATPARKEFSYPRHFTVTSPHERILQRFREARKFVETSVDNDDTDTSADITMKQIASSTALYDVTLASDSTDNTIRGISTIISD